MAAIILPHRRMQQPQTRPDLSHPWLKGARLVVMPSVSDANLVPGSLPRIADGPLAYSNSTAGRIAVTNTGATPWRFPASSLGSGVVTCGTILTVPQINSVTAWVPFTGIRAGGLTGLELSDLGDVRFEWAGVGWESQGAVGLYPTLGRASAIGGSAESSGARLIAMNGDVRKVSSYGPRSLDIDAISSAVLAIGRDDAGAGNGCSGGAALVVWIPGVAWTAAQLAEWSANPWQIFAPQPRRLFVSLAGEAAGATYRALTVILGQVQQVPTASLALGLKPLVLTDTGTVRLRAGAEGKPLVLVAGKLSTLPVGGTLEI